MNLRRRLSWLCCLAVLGAPVAGEACTLTSPAGDREDVFARRLVGPCTSAQRQALAVSASDVFHAIREGRHLDLVGVEIAGAVHLDRLPVETLAPETVPASELRAALLDRGIDRVRVVRGAITIRDSHLPQVFATNLTDGAIVFHGPVDMQGTVFHRSIDFSKAVFLQPVDFSNALILYEAFFIGARFQQPAVFEHVAFGTHTRFHRAVFQETVDFTGSRFQGLAEFLEIQAERAADFAQTVFVQGTGFSGARFAGKADFSHARFERETFFRFTTFRSHVDFSHAVFEQHVDFTEAVFEGTYDFRHSTFAVPPRLDLPDAAARSSNAFWPWLSREGLQIVVFALLATATVLMIWGVRRA